MCVLGVQITYTLRVRGGARTEKIQKENENCRCPLTLERFVCKFCSFYILFLIFHEQFHVNYNSLARTNGAFKPLLLTSSENIVYAASSDSKPLRFLKGWGAQTAEIQELF